jgi:large subunit ribosomal protein L1
MPSKRYRKAREMVEGRKSYPLAAAVDLLSKFPRAKFNETVDLAFRLGVDPKQSDQMVRGTVALPHGTGKVVRILVFAKPGAAADAARGAGAEHVGYDELIKKCSEGWADFDIAVATPEAMAEVRKLGKVLGPRGLMPNPKTGTVTFEVGKAVADIRKGRVEYKVEKAGIVQVPIGKVSFDAAKLYDNASAIIESVIKAKPASCKGRYLKSAVVSSTMGPGVLLDAVALMKQWS